ncbi:MAG: sulfotransferase family 2 domain-containing protein [Gammaproteobacteria bacterium]|nr:sulfotransferase family 2 domain-containing protein [Gammaproteobacteria bacterium]
MIVSHRHRYIFFAVPKTATHAVREALRQNLGDDDWEQQVLTGQQFLPIPALARIGHGHISAQQAQAHLPEAMWRDYKKLAFVRNPYDRFVSACAFLNRNNPDYQASPLAWMKLALGREKFRQRILIQPQAGQLCDEQGDLAMDFVGRYESLQESMHEMCDLLALPRVELQRRNTSNHRAYHETIDAELQQALTEFYADDLRLFDYRF